MRELEHQGMKIWPDTWLAMYNGADGMSSLDCWALPASCSAFMKTGTSSSAQHKPLELHTTLNFHDGTLHH
jgi:hypothetical protein